jgi:class 3 adenylate cyclase
MGPQEHKVERRLAAIFAADVANYSRLMERRGWDAPRPNGSSRDHGPSDH